MSSYHTIAVVFHTSHIVNDIKCTPPGVFGVSFIILCRYVIDILKMCMWKIKGIKIFFDKFTAF